MDTSFTLQKIKWKINKVKWIFLTNFILKNCFLFGSNHNWTVTVHKSNSCRCNDLLALYTIAHRIYFNPTSCAFNHSVKKNNNSELGSRIREFNIAPSTSSLADFYRCMFVWLMYKSLVCLLYDIWMLFRHLSISAQKKYAKKKYLYIIIAHTHSDNIDFESCVHNRNETRKKTNRPMIWICWLNWLYWKWWQLKKKFIFI